MYKVSIVKCSSYKNEEVKSALLASLKNINFEFKPGIKVLIKPNLLSPSLPEKAITTHPVIIEELCKILASKKAEIYIGDSSAVYTDQALETCGMNKLSKYGKIINFESEKKKILNFGEKMSKIPLPKILFDVDLVINIAKMKTHGLTQVTLCVKNLYGCIPGELKSELHKLLPHVKDFSKLLVNLEETIKPELNIIDGTIGIEGEGPGSAGKITKPKMIIASKNAFAADIIASEIMGFKPKSIYTNKMSGIKREDIEISGNNKNAHFFFQKPKSQSIMYFMFLNRLFPKPQIYFDKEKCEKCHLCESKCPVKAVSLDAEKGYPECNHKKCIRCLCCIEVCPHRAVSLKEHWSKQALMYLAKKVIKY